MKRYIGHALAGLALVGTAATSIAACAHDDSSLFVQDVLAPQLVSSGQVCQFTAQTTQTVLSSGTLDVDFKHEYDATFLVGNQLVQQVNSSQLMTETSIITIEGAVVRITDAAGNPLNDYTRLTAATIYPASGGVPSYAPVTATILDDGTIGSTPAIQKVIGGNGAVVRLITYTRFFGHTLGGHYVESAEFEFPVDVCRACLISFSSADSDPACLPQPNCVNGGKSSTSVQAPCVLGQDVPVDCSLCPGIADCNPAVSCVSGG